jgi:hypothetical protein
MSFLEQFKNITELNSKYNLVDLSKIFMMIKLRSQLKGKLIYLERIPETEAYFKYVGFHKAKHIILNGDKILGLVKFNKNSIKRFLENEQTSECVVCYDQSVVFHDCDVCGESVCQPCKLKLITDSPLVLCPICRIGNL